MSPIAQSLEWAVRPYELLRRCAAEVGDRFTLDLGAHGKFVVVSAPDDVREVFHAGSEVLHAGEGNGVLRRFLGDGSLLLLEEHEHVRERQLLMPAFTPARARAHAELIRTSTEQVMRGFPVGTIASVRNASERIALRVILHIVLGCDALAESASIEDRVRAFLDDPKFNLALLHQLGDDTPKTGAWAEFAESLASIRATFRDLIERRRSASPKDDAEAGDVLSILAAATEDGAALSAARIEDELLTLVVTGYETTATALSWAAVWLTREPRVRDALRARVCAADPVDAIKEPYLDAVCREVLRIHPVIPIVARRALVPFRMGDLTLPAGVTVAPCIYLAHHRASTWGDPDAFRPERFLEREPTPFEYLPFGGGARRCLGMPLALLEMRIALAWQARNVGFDVVDAASIRPRRRSVTIAPSGVLLARVHSPEEEPHARFRPL